MPSGLQKTLKANWNCSSCAALRHLQNTPLLETVYHCLLESHISYSIEIWGADDSGIERILIWEEKPLK